MPTQTNAGKRSGDATPRKPVSKPYTPQYGVIVLCDTEKDQEKVYNALGTSIY